MEKHRKVIEHSCDHAQVSEDSTLHRHILNNNEACHFTFPMNIYFHTNEHKN